MGDVRETVEAKFGKLSAAEAELLEAALTGKTPERDAALKLDDFIKSEGAAARTVRAELIRWLCTYEAAVKALDRRGLRLELVVIHDELDLRFIALDQPLSFKRCQFASPVRLSYARIAAVCFDDSNIQQLNAEGLDVKGTLLLRRLYSHGVNLMGAIVRNDVDLEGAIIDSDGIALNLERA